MIGVSVPGTIERLACAALVVWQDTVLSCLLLQQVADVTSLLQQVADVNIAVLVLTRLQQLQPQLQL
jgi:hypothetical protein